MNSRNIRDIIEAYSEVHIPVEHRILSENPDVVIAVIAESVFQLGYTAEDFIEFLNESSVEDIVEFFVDIYEENFLIESAYSDEFITEQFIDLYEYGILDENRVTDVLKSASQAGGFARDVVKSGWKQATKGGGGLSGGIDAMKTRISRQMQQANGSLRGAIQKASPLGAGALNKVKGAVDAAKTRAGELVNKVKSKLPGGGGGTPPKSPGGGGPGGGGPGGGGPGPVSSSWARRRGDLYKTAAAGTVATGVGIGIDSLLNKTQNKPQARRTEKLVGSANFKGGLKASPKSDESAKNINKRGGMSLASGGTGYLAKKGDSYVIKKAKAIGSDDGFIGQAARSLGLTKQKDKAAEAARQKISNTNRVKYLGKQGLTAKNQAGYMAKGAKLGGMKTGENILKAHFEMWVDGLLAEGYDLSNYTWDGLYEEYIQIISE
jgi:hypothetical protein